MSGPGTRLFWLILTHLVHGALGRGGTFSPHGNGWGTVWRCVTRSRDPLGHPRTQTRRAPVTERLQDGHVPCSTDVHFRQQTGERPGSAPCGACRTSRVQLPLPATRLPLAGAGPGKLNFSAGLRANAGPPPRVSVIEEGKARVGGPLPWERSRMPDALGVVGSVPERGRTAVLSS